MENQLNYVFIWIQNTARQVFSHEKRGFSSFWCIWSYLLHTFFPLQCTTKQQIHFNLDIQRLVFHNGSSCQVPLSEQKYQDMQGELQTEASQGLRMQRKNYTFVILMVGINLN